MLVSVLLDVLQKSTDDSLSPPLSSLYVYMLYFYLDFLVSCLALESPDLYVE